MNDFTALQRRVVVLGWVTYAAYYLGRVNLATALPAMEAEFGWQPAETSVFAGAILWTYALGQLFNGWLGERLDPRKLVFFGIVGSTFVNLLMAVVTAYNGLVLLALANGFLQAMGWGPILRTLSDALSGDQRRRIAGVFGASYVVGNTLTWLLTAVLLTGGRWQLIFIIPPLIMLGFGVMWYRLSPSVQAPHEGTFANRTALVNLLKQIWVFLFTAVIAGALLNGALFFAPTFVAQTLPLDQAALTAVIFPIFGLLGTVWLGSAVLQRTRGAELRGLLILLGFAAVARGLALLLPPSTLSAVVVLAGLGITAYALTNMLLTAVPLLYAHLGTSLVAGVMDATHSIGGAIGSTLVGVLLTNGDWSLVFGMWLLLPLLAMLLIILFSAQSNHRQPNEATILSP